MTTQWSLPSPLTSQSAAKRLAGTSEKGPSSKVKVEYTLHCRYISQAPQRPSELPYFVSD